MERKIHWKRATWETWLETLMKGSLTQSIDEGKLDWKQLEDKFDSKNKICPATRLELFKSLI
jgi:hypothetical protein